MKDKVRIFVTQDFLDALGVKSVASIQIILKKKLKGGESNEKFDNE